MARDPSIDIGSPQTHGWSDGENGIEPVLYEGLTALELIDGMLWVFMRGKYYVTLSALDIKYGLAALNIINIKKRKASITILKLPSYMILTMKSDR